MGTANAFSEILNFAALFGGIVCFTAAALMLMNCRKAKGAKQPLLCNIRSSISIAISFICILAGIALLVIPAKNWNLLGRPGSSQAQGKKAQTAQVSEPASAAASASKSKIDGKKILGKWMRTDGNYIIDIEKIRDDGTLKAGYYNPQPINVSKANLSAAEAEKALKIFVELQDQGYPGCTYNLTYDPAEDIFSGVYYQAAQQAEYQVVFVRMQ